MEECYEIAHETKARGDLLNVSESLKPIYDRLQAIRMELERLSLTHRWTLKETDLYNYTVALAEIDRMRKDGRWGELEEKDTEGEKKSKAAGQYVSGSSKLSEVLRLRLFPGAAVCAEKMLRPHLQALVIE